MKKIYIVIICVLLTFIPTFIAGGSYYYTQLQPVKQDTVNKIDIVSPDNTLYVIDKESDSSGFIEFAITMNETSEKILALPDPLLNAPYFRFTYYSYDKFSEYKYYFTNHSSDAYFIDPAGSAHRISKDSAEKFLKTDYAHCIYDYYKVPVLTINNDSVVATNAEWQFKGFDGEFTTAKNEDSEFKSIETFNAPSLSFDIEPDELKIRLSENDDVLYDGYFSELSNNDFSGHSANAQITAIWYDSPDRSYRGEVIYDFTLIFKKPPMFFISDTSATTGGLITVSVLDAENLSDINITTEPSMGITPVFYRDGDYARAIIPVSSALIPGAYKISADYNGQSAKEFVVDISSKYTASYPYNVDKTLFNSLYTTENINNYNKLFNSFFENLSETRLFDGKFISGLPASTFESADYGDLLTISENDVPFENPGVYYSCTTQSNVTAVNTGKVIYAGNDALCGNIIAIDHGLGVVSVYKHLASVNVKSGDNVSKGDTIGLSGRTGFISKKSAHITLARVELYVNKIAVDIDPLISNGLVVTQ